VVWRFWKYRLNAVSGTLVLADMGEGLDHSSELGYLIDRTTDEIKALLGNADLNFETVLNQALNAYLPRIFRSCPISEDLCMNKTCPECPVFKKKIKK